MKRCTKSLIISEKQTKSRTRYYFMPISMATVCVYEGDGNSRDINQKTTTGEVVDKLETLCTICGYVKICKHPGKQYGRSQKTKNSFA